MTSKHHKDEKELQQYIHEDKKRSNNPQVGLVTAETDISYEKKSYSFDPHLDPQLNWAGKAEEGVNFNVDTVSLHVHQRVDPLTIIDVIKRKELPEQRTLFHYFESTENNPPIREAIEFYRHLLGWTNRLIAGDSLLVMNSLLEKEGFSEKVQMIYIDPPYGITYNSNFQPFVNKREVKNGKDEDLTQEPEMIKAFRDSWELGIHSYLSYLRNRLLLSRDLLHESGSCFVQISDDNIHHLREVMDEIFGANNFVSIITFRKKGMPFGSKTLERMSDYLIWYAKDINKIKFKNLFVKKNVQGASRWNYVELPDGSWRFMTNDEWNDHSKLPKDVKIFQSKGLKPSGYSQKMDFTVEFQGKRYKSPYNGCWMTTPEGMNRLIDANRIVVEKNSLRAKIYLQDYPVSVLTNLWDDTSGASNKIYVVQTMDKVVQRCILMTTDPGDLVFDPTCGSGTTAYVAEQWGRRWITCDTSRVAITIAKQRLMTSVFDYYELAHEKDGISGGFNYNKVPHVTLGSIINNESPKQEILYDRPLIDRSKKRVSGPFTVEAVPSPKVISFEEIERNNQEADMSIARYGETARQNDWIDELLATGIKGKGGQKIEFVRIESLPGTKDIHAIGETKDGQKGVISFGPKHSPLEQKQVELALQESHSLVPKPSMIVFASFQFDPEAAKDIDVVKWPGITVLKVQMNTDLLTSDLKKKRSSNESFWLIGQPDIGLIKKGDEYIVEVKGFDYYNTRTGQIESGDVDKIAMWELDTDYDGRSLYPRQVFFPMSGQNDGWSKLAKNLKSHIDEDLIEQYRGTVSLPFKMGSTKQIAVKIIDDRGIESLRVMDDRDVSSK